MKHFVSVLDAAKDEFLELVALAEDIKKNPDDYSRALERKTLVMLFEKPSTRTRLSFEIAMTQMGGHAVYFNPRDTQFKKEDLKDTAKMFSIYSNVVCARVFSHATLEELAKHSDIPVINALSDLEHPTQALADILAIKEHKGFDGTRVAFIGDGNNVCNSLMLACAYAGLEFTVACPNGYGPNPELVRRANDIGGKIKITHVPEEAARGAHVVYTDVWVSMGQEEEAKKRMEAFLPYQVTPELMNLTDNAVFMHCLPALRGCEVAADVIDSKYSIVYPQAENKLHAQKAVIARLAGAKMIKKAIMAKTPLKSFAVQRKHVY